LLPDLPPSGTYTQSSRRCPFLFRGGSQNRVRMRPARFCAPPLNGHNQPDHGEDALTPAVGRWVALCREPDFGILALDARACCLISKSTRFKQWLPGIVQTRKTVAAISQESNQAQRPRLIRNRFFTRRPQKQARGISLPPSVGTAAQPDCNRTASSRTKTPAAAAQGGLR